MAAGENDESGSASEADVRASMGDPTRVVKGRTVDAPMYRRTDVSGRPFSNRGFMRVLLVIGIVLMAGVVALAKFGDVRPTPNALPTTAAVVMSGATAEPGANAVDQADTERMKAAINDRRSNMRDVRQGYGGAVADLDQTADQLDKNGNPKPGSPYATGSSSQTGGAGTGTGGSAAPAGPAATVAPDGSNLGSAGTHVGNYNGVSTNDVPPGSSGGAIQIAQNGLPIAMPTSPAQGRLAERAAAESAARTAGLRPSSGPASTAVAMATGGGPTVAQPESPTADQGSAAAAAARALYIQQVAQASGATPAPLVRRTPSSPFLLRMGTNITLVADAPLNSDNPVIVTAHVTQDVRDSIWKRYVLLPANTGVVIKLDSAGLGATRVTVKIIRFNFPDGTYMDLPDQSGTGPDGEGGFGGQVNDHRGRVFSAAILTGALSAIPIIAAGGAGSALTGQTPAQAVGGQVATQISSAGSQIVQRNMTQAPTIFVPAASIQGMVLDRDIPFAAPWVPNYPTGASK